MESCHILSVILLQVASWNPHYSIILNGLTLSSICLPLIDLLTSVSLSSLQLESDHWSSVSTDIEVINTWTEESPHNYANNQNITKTFNSPGAKYFKRKYDYLEFSNTTGTTHKFDQKVGSDSWPLRLEIKGNKLKFLFHSDQSNNEWGYKFTVSLVCVLYDSHEINLGVWRGLSMRNNIVLVFLVYFQLKL